MSVKTKANMRFPTRLVAGAFLLSGCTVIHVVGEYPNIKTTVLPGIAIVSISGDKTPLYVSQKTLGTSISTNQLVLGFSKIQYVTTALDEPSSCLLISITESNTSNDFSFKKKDPEHVCKIK